MKIFYLIVLSFSFTKLIAQEVVIFGNDTICSNEKYASVFLDFQNKGVPPYSVVYSIDNVLQDTINTNLNVYNIKTKIPGTYLIEYFSDAADNGKDTISGSAIVTVNQIPNIQLFASSDTISLISPKVHFQVFSDKTLLSQQWDFGDGSPIIIKDNPTHLFLIEDQNTTASEKYFLSNVIIEDFHGCSDTMSYFIYVEKDHYFWMPNSFTPDYDNINDKFCFYFKGLREKSFLFNIFSSDGSLVFSTKDINKMDCNLNQGWTGKHYKTDILLVPDIYVYKLYFQDTKGWKHQKYGKIILSL